MLVHGYPDNQEVWEPIIEKLVNDYFVVTYDVRGAGCLPFLNASSIIVCHVYLWICRKWLIRFCQTVIFIWQRMTGVLYSRESATEPKLKGRLLSHTTISGPCPDHASLYLREKFKSAPSNVLKMLTKSWYIGAFHLPLLAPTAWTFFSPEKWGKILSGLEKNRIYH